MARAQKGTPSKSAKATPPTLEQKIGTELVDALTAAESRLLDVLSDPDSRGRTVTQRAELAGIDRRTYYKLMERPNIAQAAKVILSKIAEDGLDDALRMLVASANLPGAEGFRDRKLLLELTGLYQPTKRQIHEAAAPPSAAEADMVRALVQYEAPERRWPPVLLARYKAGMIEGVAKPVESREVKHVQEAQG